MAKFPVPCKDERAQKMIMSFSELEIDLVWLLVQMSNSDGKLIQVKTNKKDDAEQGSCEGDACNLQSLFHTISEEDEEEIYPMRRNKRIRSIDHIYQVTEPVLQGFVHSKKKRLSC
ncbi:hypothetical protein SADUNF_Sadunf16G0116100 [Salix dunnii]|uniref:Uncharacterized protein n=1 Tax=Salix dunnii TaxID=1413687 RepID=A0A835MGP8_9ROSI|nr:hypothetical protein SADUNF_Sadunf16G0116100 [Salix dunnii]